MSDNPLRIPFQAAIDEKRLLKPRFEQLSLPQRTALKIIYGCELSPRIVDAETGWSELDLFAIFHESCEYDELGNVTKVIPLPYVPTVRP